MSKGLSVTGICGVNGHFHNKYNTVPVISLRQCMCS